MMPVIPVSGATPIAIIFAKAATVASRIKSGTIGHVDKCESGGIHMEKNELISREALLDKIAKHTLKSTIHRGVTTSAERFVFEATKGDIYKKVIEAPTVDAAPVVHAQWIGVEYDGYADGYPVYDVWECSKCGEEHRGEYDTLSNYCPNCGAKMDGKEEEECGL